MNFLDNLEEVLKKNGFLEEENTVGSTFDMFENTLTTADNKAAVKSAVDVRSFIDVDTLISNVNKVIAEIQAGKTPGPETLVKVLSAVDLNAAIKILPQFEALFTELSANIKKSQPTPAKQPKVGKVVAPQYVEGSDVKASAHFEIEEDETTVPTTVQKGGGFFIEPAPEGRTGIRSQGKVNIF